MISLRSTQTWSYGSLCGTTSRCSKAHFYLTQFSLHFGLSRKDWFESLYSHPFWLSSSSPAFTTRNACSWRIRNRHRESGPGSVKTRVHSARYSMRCSTIWGSFYLHYWYGRPLSRYFKWRMKKLATIYDSQQTCSTSSSLSWMVWHSSCTRLMLSVWRCCASLQRLVYLASGCKCSSGSDSSIVSHSMSTW